MKILKPWLREKLSRSKTERKKGSGMRDSGKHLSAGDTGKQKGPAACDVSKQMLHLGITASYVLQCRRGSQHSAHAYVGTRKTMQHEWRSSI